MSKYKQIITTIKSQAHITRALDELGVKYRLNSAIRDWQGAETGNVGQVVVGRSQLGNWVGDLGWTLDDAGCFICNIDAAHSKKAQEIYQFVAQHATLYQIQELAAANGFDCQVVEDAPHVARVYVGGVNANFN